MKKDSLRLIPKAIKKLFAWRRGIVKPEDISKRNLEQADTVIDFAASPQWPAYQEYIERKMARSIEEAFKLLDDDKDGALRAKLAEAKALYSFLKDVDNAYHALKMENDRVNKPLMS